MARWLARECRWAFASGCLVAVWPGLPAFIAPFFWAATGVHYADLAGVWRRMRAPALYVVAALGLLAVLLTIPAWSAIASYGDFIRLLDSSLRLHHAAPPPAARTPALLALGLALVVYVAACACLPWISLALFSEARPRKLNSSRQSPRVEAMARCSGTPPTPGGAPGAHY